MSLKKGLVPEPGDPTLAAMGDTTREPQQIPPGPAGVPVYLVNATRTSQGPGPGLKYLPPLEANALVRAKLAVAGTGPPRGYEDGGQPLGAAPAVQEFRENTPRDHAAGRAAELRAPCRSGKLLPRTARPSSASPGTAGRS